VTAGVTDGLSLVPRGDAAVTKRDFTSDQEVRWCPGCGDYAILATFQSFLPTLGVPRENVVVISGIGCAARLPYYVDTFGIHSIHGRAPTLATGLAVTRPELSIWVIGGDGDLLSIGTNHLVHTLRRNVNVNILLLNNRIYGLTKGQYSPTSEARKVTKSTPAGSIDHPLNPLSLALGAEATFVARTIDSDRQHQLGVLQAAAHHRGTSFVEILQNCDIYNDGAFADLKDPAHRDDTLVRLEPGRPIHFGADSGRALRLRPDGDLEVVASDAPGVLVHDPAIAAPSRAFALARLGRHEGEPTALGVLRQVERPTYDDLARAQVAASRRTSSADLAQLLAGNETWQVRGGD
jgi:2-oxoglutarate ferredoxin oxidoreductase subunit beta